MAITSALVGLVMSPITANAATAPEVNWASSVEDDLGTLAVSATADAGVTALRAHIQSYATGEDVAVVDDFVLVSGTVQDGVWRTPEPLQLDELGYYKVVVDVTDGNGEQASGPAYGTFSYVVRTKFSPLRLDPPTVTYTQRSVRVSGIVTGTMPGSREVVPASGATIGVGSIMAEGQPVSTTTAHDGSFSATVRMLGPGKVSAEVDHSDSHYTWAGADADVSVSPAKSKITVRPSAKQVDHGESITLSGQATWRSPQGWLPLANKQIGVLFCVSEDYCPSSDHLTTDSEGRYELPVVPWQTGYYMVGFPSYDPFIADAQARTDVVVWQPAEFSEFTAARDEAGDVVVTGSMAFGNFTPWPIPVQIQYKAAGSSAWTTVTTVDANGYDFSATVAESGKGRWRAFYAGQPNMYRPVASAPVLVP